MDMMRRRTMAIGLAIGHIRIMSPRTSGAKVAPIARPYLLHIAAIVS